MGKRIHCLDADAVETHGFLESLAVVFRAGVDLRRAVEKFPERNPAPEIANLHAPFLIDLNTHFFAVAHDVLVDRVIHRFLEQDVNPVIRR